MTHANRQDPRQRSVPTVFKHAAKRPPPAHASPRRPARALLWWVGGIGALVLLVSWISASTSSSGQDRLAGRPPSPDSSTSVPGLAESTPTPTGSGDPAGVRYADCEAAWAAGAAPIYSGEPGYEARLDPDNDGIACEGDGSVVRSGAPGQSPRPARSANPHPNDPRFASCAEAKANGYGPYIRGEGPEYAWYRPEDTDNDGVVCS